MVIATRADVDTRSNIVRLPDADTSKKGYKFTDPDGEFPRVVPLPVQGDVVPDLMHYENFDCSWHNQIIQDFTQIKI